MPMYELIRRSGWNDANGYGSALIYENFWGTLVIPGPPLWYSEWVPQPAPPRKRRKHKKGNKR